MGWLSELGVAVSTHLALLLFVLGEWRVGLIMVLACLALRLALDEAVWVAPSASLLTLSAEPLVWGFCAFTCAVYFASLFRQLKYRVLAGTVVFTIYFVVLMWVFGAPQIVAPEYSGVFFAKCLVVTRQAVTFPQAWQVGTYKVSFEPFITVVT